MLIDQIFAASAWSSFSEFFSSKELNDALRIMKEEFPLATWDTLYVTVLSTVLAFVIGLPLGILLVVGEKGNMIPYLSPVVKVLNVIINALRSVPFTILMILVIPLTRLIIGTSIGTEATIVPLVVAAFPFVARIVESSIREVNPNLVEMAQSMGASPFQIIVKVLIPESVPSLISGLTLALTTILGYTAMSGALGGNGLGRIAYNYGYVRFQTIVLITSVILLVILVQLMQTIGTALATRSDKRLKNKK